MDAEEAGARKDVEGGRLPVLDGWRGISILLVLACHLLPLGPKPWNLNATAGPMGMALFFTLSGFLITRFLMQPTSVPDFLIRRLFRIVPLAWLGLAVALPAVAAPLSSYFPNFLFYANWPPTRLVDISSHYWSLCVEVQFYAGIALLVALFGRRGLYLLPLLCAAVTIHRVVVRAPVDIATWLRGDEILAGGLLAMAQAGRFGAAGAAGLRRLNSWVLLALLPLCCHPRLEALNYLRPYVAALLVGSTLQAPPAPLARILRGRMLAYVAAVSYALYVVHHLLMYTWLGTGSTTLEKYAKRPLLLAATFWVAHVSTFHLERRLIVLGKRLSVRLRGG